MNQEEHTKAQIREEIKKYILSLDEMYEAKDLDNEMTNDAIDQRIDEIMEIANTYFER